MPPDFNYTPTPTLKAAFYGLEKRGKTHGLCSLACALYRELGLEGHVGIVATENWVDDWHVRLSQATKRKIAPCFTSDPSKALEFVRECEASGQISLILLDSMSELLQAPRQEWIRKNGGKGIPLNLYQAIDQPFAMLSGHLKNSKTHWIATMREDDEKQETDGNEIVVGKKAKAKDFGYVPRLLVHCRLARHKGDAIDYVWRVSDCGGESKTIINGKMDEWGPFLQRFKAQ